MPQRLKGSKAQRLTTGKNDNVNSQNVIAIKIFRVEAVGLSISSYAL